MKLGFGSNLLSLNTQRHLSDAIDDVGRSFERLSSGLRINRASDDPAGLAVSEILGTKSRVLTQAQRNVNDSISFLQVADGAISSISSLTVRMAELAEQASNGVFSAEQRSALNEEYVALDKEINRITSSTSFNGISLLKGGKHDGSSELITDIGLGSATITSTSTDGTYILHTGGAAGFTTRDTRTGAITPAGTIGATKAVMDGFGNVIHNDLNFGFTDVYITNAQTGVETTLTASGNTNDAGAIAVSADGSTIAFTSFTHYVDGGNLGDGTTAGNQRIFSYDVASGVFTSYDTDISSVAELNLSADGSKIAFSSDVDITGENADTNQELFLIDQDDPSGTITQLTNSSATEALLVSGVSNSGEVVFTTTRDISGDITGDNPVGTRQLFSASTEGERQLTSGEFALGGNATLNAQGTTAYFISSDNFTGENPGGYNQGFRFDIELGEVTQTTNYTSSVFGTGRFSQDGSTFLSSSGSLIQKSDLSNTEVNLNVEAGFGGKNGIVASIGDIRGSLSGLGAYVLSSQEYAQAALESMKGNIDTLANIRGEIGSSLSRLSSANSVLAGQTDAFKAARARITDLDFAAETAKLTAKQIQNEASVAVLAQANQQPQLVLQLLALEESD